MQTGAFALCVLAYALALGAAFLAALGAGRQHPILIALLADIAATLVVYCFSRGLHNASFYDPYWSLAPIAIALYFGLAAFPASANAVRRLMVIALVCAWALRLTYNWARQWRGLGHEDWRYADLRKSSGRWFWIVDLVGIEMMPTLVVFAGCLPLYAALSAGSNPPGAAGYPCLHRNRRGHCDRNRSRRAVERIRPSARQPRTHYVLRPVGVLASTRTTSER